MIPVYRANRLVAAIVVLFAFVLSVLWDRGLLNMANAARRGEVGLRRLGFDWLASMCGRLAGDLLTLTMVLAFLVVLIYIALQFWGAASDRRALASEGSSGRSPSVSAFFTGRSGAVMDSLRGATDRHAIDTHFSFGREALLGPVKFAQWAYPVIGFIGTVIGVSGAVQKLPSAVRGGQMDERMLNAVLDDLHVAFDTTFVGLAASVAVMIGLYLLDSKWDRNELLAARRLRQLAAPADTANAKTATAKSATA